MLTSVRNCREKTVHDGLSLGVQNRADNNAGAAHGEADRHDRSARSYVEDANRVHGCRLAVIDGYKGVFLGTE
jgi:hypothetical protein